MNARSSHRDKCMAKESTNYHTEPNQVVAQEIRSRTSGKFAHDKWTFSQRNVGGLRLTASLETAPPALRGGEVSRLTYCLHIILYKITLSRHQEHILGTLARATSIC